MKKKLLAFVLATAMVASLAACGKKSESEVPAAEEETAEEEAVEEEPAAEEPAEEAEVHDEEVGDIPNNEFEDRVGKTTFESFDEIIGLLEGDEAYAITNVYGYDGDVLAVAEMVYDDQLGHMAATECFFYSVKADGTCTTDGLVFSGGTATPVSMDDQGVIWTASHVSVEKSCYGDNGTGVPVIIYLTSVYTDEFDDNGDPKTVSGFVRTSNSLVNDDSVFLEEDDVDTLKQLFADYEKTEPINFTKVADK